MSISVDVSSLFRGPSQAIGTGIRRNWFPLLTFIVIEAVILSAYLVFKDRFLIPSWQFWLASALLLLAVGFWITWRRSGRRQVAAKVVAIVLAVALSVVLGGSIFRIVRPERLPSDAFGIALARFGEGSELKPTQRGKDISYSADLVIWGRLVAGEDAVTVHFEVLEAPASALHPEYPRVLPIGYEYSADVTTKALDISSISTLEIKEAVASQADAITYFVLGLAFYLKREYQEAIDMFERAKEALGTESENSMLNVDPNTGGWTKIEITKQGN